MVRWQAPYLDNRYFHKGQTHCHCDDGEFLGWNIKGDDGNQSIDDVVKAYRDFGYGFMSVTSHNCAHVPEHDVPGILYIRGTEDGYADRHHVIVLGLDERAAAAAPDVRHFDQNGNGLCDWATKPCANLPGRLYYYASLHKAVVVLAHPTDDHETKHGFALGELRQSAMQVSGGHPLYGGDPAKPYACTGIEVVNGPTWSDTWWNVLLDEGHRVWGLGADDCHSIHNGATFNRNWIVVNSASAKPVQADILTNISRGSFYTVARAPHSDTGVAGPRDRGPDLRVSVVGAKLRVETQPGNSVSFITGPNRSTETGARETAPQRQTSGMVEWPLPETIRWVRVKVEMNAQPDTMWALSQPIFNLDYRPPQPDPCQALAQKRDRAAANVTRVQNLLRKNPDDEELVGQLHAAQAQLAEAKTQLQRCRQRNPGDAAGEPEA